MAYRFAKDSDISCQLSAKDLMDKMETQFFDPRILYTTSSGDKLYTIPITVTNAASSGQTSHQVQVDSNEISLRSIWQDCMNEQL